MRCDDEGARYSSTAADAAIRRPLRTNGYGVSGPDDAYARHFGSGVAGLLPTITVWRIRMEAAL
jgi:hypothetical protein